MTKDLSNLVLENIASPIIAGIVIGIIFFLLDKLYEKIRFKKELCDKLRKQYNVALYNVYITNEIVKLSKEVLQKNVVSELYFPHYENYDLEMIICVDEFISKVRSQNEDKDITLQIYSIFKHNLEKLSVYCKLLDEALYNWRRTQTNEKLDNNIKSYYNKINTHMSLICVNVIQILNHITITLDKEFKLKLDPYQKQYCNEVFKIYKNQISSRKTTYN